MPCCYATAGYQQSILRICTCQLEKWLVPQRLGNKVGVSNYDNVYYVILCSGEQHKNPDLIAINPNHTLPAMEDDGFTLFERYAKNLECTIMF